MATTSKPQLLEPVDHRPTEAIVVHGTEMMATAVAGPIEWVADLDIWERHPEETNRQWAFFQYYRDMDAYDRSVKAVYEYFFPDASDDTACNSIYELCQRFRWKERTSEHDRSQDEQFRSALLIERVRARKGMASLGSDMRDLAAKALKHTETVIKVEVMDADGNVHIEEKTVLTVKEILDLAKVGADLETTALDMKGEGIVARQVNLYLTDSDDKLVEDARELLRAKDAIIDVTPRAVDAGK